jgi:large subunit ribosomal protein L25
METIELNVELREVSGKGGARLLRRAGRIPGVLYGRNRATVAVALDARDFETRVASLEGSHLLRLQSSAPDVNGRLALVKELQRDPVTSKLVHTDLYEVDVDTKIRVNVPLHFVGKSQGVEMGGILQPIRREVAVLCLPSEIPEFIEVDVSALGINEALHLNQLRVPQGIEVQADGEVTLVTVLPPVVEEVKVEEAAAPAEGAPAAETQEGETSKS